MTTPNHQTARINRLRNWIVGLVVVIVFAATLGPLAVISAFQRSSAETQIEINCVTLKSSINELRTLAGIADQLDRVIASLGLPIHVHPPIEIPEVPPECDGF